MLCHSLLKQSNNLSTGTAVQSKAQVPYRLFEVSRIGNGEDGWRADDHETDACTCSPNEPLEPLPTEILEAGYACQQAHGGPGDVCRITDGILNTCDVTLSIKVNDDVTQTD